MPLTLPPPPMDSRFGGRSIRVVCRAATRRMLMRKTYRAQPASQLARAARHERPRRTVCPPGPLWGDQSALLLLRGRLQAHAAPALTARERPVDEHTQRDERQGMDGQAEQGQTRDQNERQ